MKEIPPGATGLITVRGEDPLRTDSPLFSNFVAISHVGNDVQLEFVYVDIAQLAAKIQEVQQLGTGTTDKNFDFQGKTVVKVVVPASSFVQLKEHMMDVFNRLEARNEAAKDNQEATPKRGYGA